MIDVLEGKDRRFDQVITRLPEQGLYVLRRAGGRAVQSGRPAPQPARRWPRPDPKQLRQEFDQAIIIDTAPSSTKWPTPSILGRPAQ